MTLVSHARKRHDMRPLLFALILVVVAGVSVGVTYWARPAVPDITGSITSACLARLPSNFSPRVFDHCVAACIECDRGSRVTCSTSCRLRGAN